MRRFAAAAQRNREPIAEVLATVLPEAGRVLEIASGSGEHVEHFAQRFPKLTFTPSDPSADARASVDAMRDELRLANVEPARALDVIAPDWPHAAGGPFDVVYCANMIHIAPEDATPGLVNGAA